MKKLWMLVLAIWASSSTYSYTQINAYTFSASPGTYTDISGGTYVRILASNAGTSVPLPLGFDFVFNGVIYNQVVATSAGFLSFNLSAVSTSTNNLATSAATLRPLLAPLWDNLRGATTNTNTTRFSYVTTGAAGSRIFTAEWKGWLWGNGNITNTISFQVKLYEGSNKIDFVYRPESSSISNPSASIGITGSGIGPGNFLSLNSTGTSPVASSSVETTTLSTKPATGQTYTFLPPLSPDVDINISNINTNAGICPNASFLVGITIRNAGNNPIDFASTNAAVSIAITGPVTQNLATTIASGNLAPGATQFITLSPAVNLSANGTYNLKSLITVAGDGNTSNDTTTTSLTLASTTAPWTETFYAASLPAGWKEEGWYVGSYTSVNGNPGNCIYKNLQTDTATGSFTSLLVGPVTASMNLTFDYRVLSVLNPYNNPSPDWGSFAVQVSSNCGNTFTTIDSVNAAGSDWISKAYSMAAYAGQYVAVRIIPKWNAGNHNLAFDNFSIKVPPVIDVAATSITTNLNACPYTIAQFNVVLKNSAATPINFAANNATVTVNITGRATQTVSAIVDTGTLAPGAVRTITVGPANLSLTGVYDFRSYATVATDGNRFNDTTTASTTVIAPTIIPVPWAEGFSYYGTLPPDGWTTTGWSRDLTSVIEPTQGYYLYRLLTANNSSNVITTATIGPVATGNRLSFDYKLFDNGNPGFVPSYAWGNFKVQISTGCSGVFTTIDSITDAGTPNGWSNKSYSLSAYAGQNITVRLVATWVAGNFSICFDNFQVYTPPATDLAAESINYDVYTCAQSNVPGSITIKNRGTGTINFATNNAQLNVTIQRATSGGQTPYAYLTSGTLAPDSSMTVTLFPNVDFINGNYEIRANITLSGDGNENNNRNIAKRSIGTSYQSVFPSAETFTTSYPPSGWSTGTWQIGSQRGATGNPGNCIYRNFNAAAATAEIKTTPSASLPARSYLSFDYKLSNYASPYAPPAAGWGAYNVQISTDCGNSFTTIDNVTATGNGWTPKIYSLAAYTGQRIITRIQASWASGDYDLAFDNFKIDSQSNCRRPVILKADSVTTITTAQVYFSGTGNNFVAEYGPVGFTPGTDTTAGTGGTLVRTTSSPVNITGLTPGTTYQVYIRQNCTAIALGYSSNSTPDTFRTKPLLPNDLPNNAILLTVGAGCNGAIYTNAGATQLANEPPITCAGLQTGGKTVWFKFKAPLSGFVRISTDSTVGTLADTRIALYAATDSSNYSTFRIIACDDNNGVVNYVASILYANELAPFQTYYIAVDGYNGTDTGSFCLKVTEVNSTMIAATGSCTAGQPVSGVKADYKGWISLTNASGQLIANVRSDTILFSPPDYRPYLYVNTGAVRQSATGEYYLNRNFRIADTARGNYAVQLYILNTELAALQAVDTSARLSNIHVTKVKGETTCNPNFVSGGAGNDTLLLQTGAGTVNGISWVTVNTNGFSNFYLHPGTSQLSRVYVFTGSGAWSNPANWSNNEVPPTILPPHCTIEINPVTGGQCIMDVVQRITSTSVFRVKSGTNMVVAGSLIIQ